MAVKKIGEFYKCSVCGNVVSVVDVGGGELVCCGKPMDLLEPKDKAEEGTEKHVPVIEKDGDHVVVKVGEVPHPMTEEHYITLIQLLKGDDIVTGKRLKPGDKPEARFCVDDSEGLSARILCNIHGVWVNG